MKKYIIIVIVVVLLAVVGFWSYNHYTNPRVVSSLTEKVTTCIAPAGRNVYEMGSVSYSFADEIGKIGSKIGSQDMCEYYVDGKYSRSGQLREQYCSNGDLLTEKIDCGYGSICRDGRCIRGGDESMPLCTDTDGGINPKVRGLTGSNAYDECWTSTNKTDPESQGGFTDICSGENCYTYEYYCQGDDRLYKIIPSPKGCENGIEK